MQNIWKAITFFMVLMFAATVEAGGVEPVLMYMDGSAIEDKELFHKAHGIVRDWQYDLLYKPGDKPADAAAALNETLAPLGVKAMMVPTTLWQMIFCEVNLLDPDFESMKRYSLYSPYETTEFIEGDSRNRYLFNYGALNFFDATTVEEAYDIIHKDTKHPRMSRLKQMVDNYIVKEYPEANNPPMWETIVRKFVATYVREAPTYVRAESRDLYAAGTIQYPETATTPALKRYQSKDNLPSFIYAGHKRFPMLVERIDYIRSILQTELNTLEHKRLLLMRATRSITFAGTTESYVLQDSPIKLEENPGKVLTDHMKSLSFATSLFGSIGSMDAQANVYGLWAESNCLISTLALPAGLSPEIRNVFWLPPLFGPLEMIRAGEYHPRLKILPDMIPHDAGIIMGGHSSYDSPKDSYAPFASQSLFHTPYPLGEFVAQYHAIASEDLSIIIPPYVPTKDPMDVDFYKTQNAGFAAVIGKIVAEGIPMVFSYGVEPQIRVPASEEGAANAGAGGASGGAGGGASGGASGRA